MSIWKEVLASCDRWRVVYLRCDNFCSYIFQIRLTFFGLNRESKFSCCFFSVNICHVQICRLFYFGYIIWSPFNPRAQSHYFTFGFMSAIQQEKKISCLFVRNIHEIKVRRRNQMLLTTTPAVTEYSYNKCTRIFSSFLHQCAFVLFSTQSHFWECRFNIYIQNCKAGKLNGSNGPFLTEAIPGTAIYYTACENFSLVRNSH